MTNSFFKIAICLLLAVAFTGCMKVKFDKEKWKMGNGLSYTMRESILEDLTTNYKLVGMSYKDVIRLLGKPDDIGPLKTSYDIINNEAIYNPKNKPLYRKNLEFYFSKDSVVTRFNVYEHTDKKGPFDPENIKL